MSEGIVIRPEREADHAAIGEVVRAAFVRHPDEVAGLVGRIGFERASALGFVPPQPATPDDAFMVKRLPGYRADLAGRIVYPAAFDALGS